MAYVKSLCIVFICLSGCLSKNLPSFIQKCKLEYPAVNDCLLQRVKALKPYLEKGIPELKIPALKPLKVPKVDIQTGNDTSSGFSATFTDIVINGAENFELQKVNFDLENQVADISVYIANLRVQATYHFKGKILILELNGSGPADANITNVNSQTHTNIKKVTRNGKQYVEIEDNLPTISYDKPNLHFGDLFKGNEELTKHTNEVINENIIEIGKEIKPLIDKTIHAFVHGTVIQIFNDFSLDELFD